MDGERAFFAVLSLVFIVSTGVTIAWCTSMSAMGHMPMPGGWTMSMTWMRMPGQTWPAAAGSFLGMWLVMMVAMMLPSLVPMLLRYRHAVGARAELPLGRLTTLVGAGYFLVWTAIGIAVFPLGAAVAATEMRQPEVARMAPIAVALVILIAGAVQFTPWKAHHLVYCRERLGNLDPSTVDDGTALRHGLWLGLRCGYCCANLTAVLLVTGVMDLRSMLVLMAAISAERFARGGERAARAIGLIIIIAGLFLSAGAIALI